MTLNSLWIIITLILSFIISSLLCKVLIPILHKLKFGQTILKIGPQWHKNKQGTPTMGGISFIFGIIISSVICILAYYNMNTFSGVNSMETPLMIVKIFAGLGMALFYGVTGFIDDYIKVVKKRNQGLNPKQKLIFQFTIAGIYLWIIYRAQLQYSGFVRTSINIPFLFNINFGIFYWFISAILIVGIVNAVNLNDGIDGLCSSITFFVGIFFMIISSVFGMSGISLESAALIGGCLAFLIWNFHPAKIFMGDTGSLFLGGIICAIGYSIGYEVILIIMALPYILEMFSVIIQVAYFKITHGRRLFKMSPIHHHFEMIGWSETKICINFSLFTIICGIFCVLLSIYAF